jgi:hypothetical protein
MLDPAVKITRVAGATGFDPVTLLPIKAEVVTYMVGDHGPFTLSTPAGMFSAQYVEDETRKKADQLRALGLVAQT